MRGKECREYMPHLGAGITPAYAGKSFEGVWRLTLVKDHPRVCGEKGYSCFPSTSGAGSPPRMRGKVHGVLEELRCVGITPAYAGKSSGCSVAADPGRDHPRVCGEKPARSSCRAVSSGSPPRMRGKVMSLGANTFGSRITPAYAGKSLTGSSGITGRKDHPRVCGEKLMGRTSTMGV